MDSIFNNLLTNSLDAFNRDDFNGNTRLINITFKLMPEKQLLSITYSDNGPGLIAGIVEPDKIFSPFFTTKKNGIGIGLWIVKSILYDYNGRINIMNTGPGFVVDIIIPTYYISIPTINLDKVNAKPKK